jgi:ligand-binding sensor domain-containing protein
MRVKLLSILIYVLFSITSNANLQDITFPYINNYTTKDYNGQAVNFAAIEDNRGIMFFGNLWGILEFDGTDWRNIYFPNGSSGISFAKDAKGIIYCGGRGEFGFLAPDSTGYLQYNSLLYLLKNKVDFCEIWSTFYVDSSIVFCSHEAVFILKNNKITVVKPQKSFNRGFLAHDKIYVREEGRGLCQLINDKMVLINGGDFFANIAAMTILPYQSSQLIIASNNHFFMYDGNSVKPWNEDIVNFLSECKLFTAIALYNSDYVLATNNMGVVIMDKDGKIKSIFNKNSGLNSNDILNLFCDSNGNLWVLTREGISKIELNGCFKYIRYYQGVPGLSYASCFYDHRLYLGTSEGLFYRDLSANNPGQGANLNFAKVPHTEGNVWALQQYGEDLFCAHNDGIFVINQQNSYRISETNGVWCFVKPKGSKDILLAGTYLGLMILEKKNQTWTMRSYVKGFNESSRFLIQDEMEEFWISHGNKGLFKLTLSHNLDSVLKVKSYGVDKGLSSTLNNIVYNFNKEVIVSNNTGLYKYNNKTDSFDQWKDVNSAIGQGMIQRVVAESEHSFWLILNNEKLIHISNDKGKGFKTDITILPISTRKTIIATQEGFAIFDLEKYQANIELSRKSFKGFVRKVDLTRDTVHPLYGGEINDLETKSAEIPKLPFKQSSIHFSFSSNCYEDIKLTQYQCFLEGFDQSWSVWSFSEVKEYTNLPAGKYKFRIRAMNSYDIVSQEGSFEFEILPPWYQSRLAYFIYFSLIVFAIIGVRSYFQYRLGLQSKRLELKIERELRKLEKKLAEEQVKNENAILKLSNEKLSAELANLEQQKLLREKDLQLKTEHERAKQEQVLHEYEKHALEIKHKNKELSILAMQIAHKSESISKMREYLISFTEKNDSPDYKAIANHLFEFIEKDIQHDKEWKEFQEYFNMVHSSFLNKLKATYPSISPALLNLCTYLRVKMSNKQIARLMNTTLDSVLKNRYRLREKLQLSSDENLDDFIENF